MADAREYVPVSRAGPYTASGLILEPGCLAMSLEARFKLRLRVLSPRQPTITLTCPLV